MKTLLNNDEMILIKEEYIKGRGLTCFNRFVRNNENIKEKLTEIIKKYPWFENEKNVFISTAHDVFQPVVCLECGKLLKPKSAIFGRHRFCSKKCGCGEKANALRKETCIKKYGCETPLLNKYIKEKTKRTCLEKYGNEMFAGSNEFKKKVSSPFLLEETQKKAINTKREKYGDNFGKVIFKQNEEKIKKTNQEKHGVDFLLQNKKIQDKTRDTMQEKYGARFFWQTQKNDRTKKHRMWKRILSWKSMVIPLFVEDEYIGSKNDNIYRWKCVNCGHEFEQRLYTTGLGDDRMLPRCLECHPYLSGFSYLEREVADFVKSIYSGEVIENSRSVISPFELDVYLPDKNLAIEFDGLFWHSEEQGKGNEYHLNKTEQCEKLGIQLIHIFEDEWVNKKEMVKSRVRSLLNIYDQVIYARKCTVTEIDSRQSNQFLEHNHLQGKDNASIRYGLYFNNELVSVMTFGKPRFNKSYDFELIRFCSKLGVQVMGGASKLLKYFQNNHTGSIVSYADKRYSVGKLYRLLGFELVGQSPPNYWWTRSGVKLSRYQCQKHRLGAMLGDGFNPEMSEAENMEFNGYSRVFDCGNLVYEFN